MTRTAETGTMYRRRPGVWRLRVRAGVDPVTGKRRVVDRTFYGPKEEAAKALAKIVKEVNRAESTPTEKTLGWLLDEWIDHAEHVTGLAATTLRTYRSYIRTTIGPTLGAVRLDRLRAADLDSLYRTMAKAGRSPSTIRQHHAILSAALGQAVRWGYVDVNVAKRATPPPTRPAKIRTPTLDEIQLLLTAADWTGEAFGLLVFLAVHTGARRGELCALRWSNVDFPTGTLLIAESISDVPGSQTVKDTKTHAVRRIALSDEAVGRLAAHRRWQDRTAAVADIPLAPDPYVCSQDPAGSVPYRPDRVTGTFCRLRDRLELPHIHLHSARHLMATHSLTSGVDQRTVAGRLGHSGGGSVTMRVYAGFVPAADRRAAEVMGRLAPAPQREEPRDP